MTTHKMGRLNVFPWVPKAMNVVMCKSASAIVFDESASAIVLDKFCGALEDHCYDTSPLKFPSLNDDVGFISFKSLSFLVCFKFGGTMQARSPLPLAFSRYSADASSRVKCMADVWSVSVAKDHLG